MEVVQESSACVFKKHFNTVLLQVLIEQKEQRV